MRLRPGRQVDRAVFLCRTALMGMVKDTLKRIIVPLTPTKPGVDRFLHRKDIALDCGQQFTAVGFGN
jgi:hypothetical protein